MFEISQSPSDGLLGKGIYEIAPPGENLEKWFEHIEDIWAHRPFRDCSHEHTYPNGNTMHISLSRKRLFDDDGEFLGYRGTGRDITVQKQQKRALAENEARFRSMADAASDRLRETDENFCIS